VGSQTLRNLPITPSSINRLGQIHQGLTAQLVLDKAVARAELLIKAFCFYHYKVEA